MASLIRNVYLSCSIKSTGKKLFTIALTGILLNTFSAVAARQGAVSSQAFDVEAELEGKYIFINGTKHFVKVKNQSINIALSANAPKSAESKKKIASDIRSFQLQFAAEHEDEMAPERIKSMLNSKSVLLPKIDSMGNFVTDEKGIVLHKYQQKNYSIVSFEGVDETVKLFISKKNYELTPNKQLCSMMGAGTFLAQRRRTFINVMHNENTNTCNTVFEVM